jgi:spermidine/putrescine transport system permease protein
MSQNNFQRVKELNVLGYPALFWFLFFLVIPLFLVIILSFLSRGTYGNIEWAFQFGNYIRVIDSTYLKIILQSFKLSISTSILCFLLGYPVAWAMATASAPIRSLLTLAIAIPFFTNLIIRVYALRIFLGIDGPLQKLLINLGFEIDPFSFSQNPSLVLYGMVTTYLPFMVFPLFAALEKFDFSLVEAAYDLGASSIQVLYSILIPNTRAAIASGLILVFVPCLGEFVIPDLLGGAKTMLAGNLITEQFLKSRNWPFGSALSVVLIAMLVVIPFAIRKSVGGSKKI